MDRSIAASASLRMRDQLRGAFHAPVTGADAGLFEELLRMPAAESRSDPDDDAPTPDQEIVAQTSAATASQKSSNQPEREENDAEDDEAEQASLSNVDTSAIVQAVPAQPAPVQPALDADDEKVAASGAAEQPHAHPSARASTDASPSPDTHAAAAVVELQPGPAEASESNAAVGQTPEPLQAVAEIPQTPADATTQSDIANDASQAPVTGALDGEAEHPDSSSRKPAEAKAGAHENLAPSLPSEAQGVPAASGPKSQAHAESASQANTDDTSVTPVQNTTVASQAEKPLAEPDRRADTSERREKWFVKDDERSQVEDSDAAGSPDAGQDRSALDALTPSPSPADAASSPTNSELLGALGDATAANAAPSAPTLDASALASALAQQSAGNSTRGSSGTSSGQSDTRMASHGVGQAMGGRATATSATHASASGAPDRDQGGVAGLSQQERVRLVQRVARSFSRLGPDGGQVTLKLHPPQLGVLNMSVRIEGQTMTARLQTETSSARDAILENLPVLRERLAEQGIEVESFRVEVASDGNVSADNPSQSQSQNPFGDDAAGSRNGPRDVDYRRLVRSSTAPTSQAATRAGQSPGWSTQLPVGRTLDVRA